MRQAVISGVGVVSAFGVGAPCFFDALAAGQSAIAPIRSFDVSTFPTRVAGEVPIPEVTAEWFWQQARRYSPEPPAQLRARAESWQREGLLRDRKLAFAVLAALEAWTMAGCEADDSSSQAWQCIALGLEHALLADFVPIVASGAIQWSRASAEVSSAIQLRTRVDLALDLLSSLLRLQGPRVVHASACAAGALAVGHAASLVERGVTDLVLCGAADSMLNPLGLGGMSRLGAPSPRNEPDACRPFDLRRDGLVMGEGAAMFVIEEEGRARRRQQTPLARVLGAGSSQDAYKATAPRPDGAAAARAMQRALARARLSPSQIGYVSAHGTGTPLNDPAEVLAIRSALGGHAESVPISSIKGAVGHLMSAAGAIEIASCLLPFSHGLLPATAHHRTRDPACDLDIIGETPRAAEVEYVLSNSFGFGGQNASVILGRVR